MSTVSELEVALDHEEVAVRQGRRTGLPVIVAVHSTLLGPAVGGLRIAPYATPLDAMADCLRLSRGMTFKAASVDNGTGGGKAVVPLLPGGPRAVDGALRRSVLLDVAEVVHGLDGRYHVAPDVGTGSADMRLIRGRTPYVGGYTFESDGMGATTCGTAYGVEHAMLSTAEHRWGTRDLAGRSVAVIGFGGVGELLATLLIARGAAVTATDINPARRTVAESLGATWVPVDDPYVADVDILAPCALGGVFTSELVGRLRCRAIVGSANNQLANDMVADELTSAGIVWSPDFVTNAGGVMYGTGIELHGMSRAAANERLAVIGSSITDILRRSQRRGVSTLSAAYELANAHLSAARTAS